jgi:hypothetical protein
MEGQSSLDPLIKLHDTDISRSGIDHSTKELASQIFFQLFGTSTTLLILFAKVLVYNIWGVNISAFFATENHLAF